MAWHKNEHLVCKTGCTSVDFETKSYYTHYNLVDCNGDFIEQLDEEFDEGSGDYTCAQCGAQAIWVSDSDEPDDISQEIDIPECQGELPLNSPFEVIV